MRLATDVVMLLAVLIFVGAIIVEVMETGDGSISSWGLPILGFLLGWLARDHILDRR